MYHYLKCEATFAISKTTSKSSICILLCDIIYMPVIYFLEFVGSSLSFWYFLTSIMQQENNMYRALEAFAVEIQVVIFDIFLICL